MLDIIALVCGHAQLHDTLDEARRFLSLPDPKPGPEGPRRRDEPKAPTGSPESARRLFAASRSVRGSLVQTYLRQRAITTLLADARRLAGEGRHDEANTLLGTAETRLILGGRFLQEDYSNTFANTPFQGHGLTGYDLLKQKYVNVWVDNLGSWLTLSEGSLDPSGKVLTLTGEMPDPQTGKGRPTKTVTRIESADRHVFEIYDHVDGKDVKIMEVTYTRRK